MLVINGNISQEQYFDKCAKYAIALLGTLDFAKISKVISISKQNYANVLSQMSIITKVLRVSMDNMADVEVIMNISRISNLRMIFSNEKYSTDNIIQIQDIMKTMTDPLTSAMNKVKTIYNLPDDALSLYNYDNIEHGVNFLSIENNLPIALLYYEGKMAFKAMSSLFDLFSSTKKEYDDKKTDMNALTINGVKNVLKSYLDRIDELIALKDELEKMIDSSQLALNVYTLYNLDNPSNKDLFLNREFALIKQDIALAV
jgi:hypothetical protein